MSASALKILMHASGNARLVFSGVYVFAMEKAELEALMRSFVRTVDQASGGQLNYEELLVRASIRTLQLRLGTVYTDLNEVDSVWKGYAGLNSEDVDMRIVETRLCHAAECLMNSHANPEFDAWFIEKAGDSFETAIAEIQGQCLLRDEGYTVTARLRTGTTRDDFDFIVETSEGSFTCEVKSKLRSTEYSRRTLTRSLNTAAGQLPIDRPGVILVMIPLGWADEPRRLDEMSDAASSVLREKAFLKSITIFWETIVEGSSGRFHMGYLLKEFVRSGDRKLFRRMQGPIPAEFGGDGSNFVSLASVVVRVVLERFVIRTREPSQ